MTLQSLNTALVWPNISFNGPGIGAGDTLDAAGEYTAVIFVAREDMVISHVGWRTTTVSGSPTADTRIETVGTDGNPSGTLWAANTNIISGTLSANTWTLHALTSPATITKGQVFCVKIVYNSGTSLIVNYLSNTIVGGAGFNLPYLVTNVTGSAVKARLNLTRNMALGSSATAFYSLSGCVPVTAVNSGTFNNTNSAARGLRFQLPFPCRCIGMQTWSSTSIGDVNALMLNDAGTELSSSSTAYDGDHNATSASGEVIYIFDNPVSLAAGTWYRAAIEPSSATNTTVGFFTLPSLNYRSAWPFGSNAHYATRASGSWTDTATDSLPYINLLLDQFDDGAGAGGMIVHPGMNGRLQ